MSIVLKLQRAAHGPNFKAFGLRGPDVGAFCDPYLNVDHAWMSAPTFPPHPHAGFSAISYVFPDSATGLRNRDSLGTQNLISPGGLHWTAAAGGIIHEEVPATPGLTVHALQIFINLPPELRDGPPFILGLEPQDVPVVRIDGVEVRVLLGDFADQASPLVAPNDVGMFDITVDAGAGGDIPIPSDHVAFVLPVSGSIAVNGALFDVQDALAPVFSPTSPPGALRLTAPQDAAQAVVFTGRPLSRTASPAF